MIKPQYPLWILIQGYNKLNKHIKKYNIPTRNTSDPSNPRSFKIIEYNN